MQHRLRRLFSKFWPHLRGRRPVVAGDTSVVQDRQVELAEPFKVGRVLS